MSNAAQSKKIFRTSKFHLLMAMQRAMGISYHIADNQTPGSRNGGRSHFKQNRSAQLKHGFKTRR